MNELLFTIFLACALPVLIALLALICLNLYEIFDGPEMQKRKRQLRGTKQPSVTVLLYARNSEASIEASLKAIMKAQYRNYDVVVVNDRSIDKTGSLVKNYIQTNPNKNIQLVTLRKRKTTQQALEAGYRKSSKGEVVISLQSGTLIPSNFIKYAVARKDNKDQVTIRVYEKVQMSNLSEIIQSLHNSLWQYAHVVVVSNPKHIPSVKLEVRYEFMGVLLLLSIGIVSILTQDFIIVWYGWLLLTGFLLGVIWLKSEGLNTKILLSFSALSALFLLPISSLIQGISQFRSRI